MALFSIALLLSSTAAAAADLSGDLTGLWTSIPAPASGAPKAKGMPGRHDALRVDGSAHAVTCEHGGYRNMSVLPCPWARAALTLGPNGSVVLATAAPGGITWSGSYQARNATACGWTLAPPGAYWTAASKYEPPFPVVDCSVITFPSNGETWVRLREVSKVHVVSMSHLDVGYTGSIAFTLNSYFAGIRTGEETERGGGTEKDRERQRETKRDRERQRDELNGNERRERERGGERERERERVLCSYNNNINNNNNI